jgi:hypothetical protein
MRSYRMETAPATPQCTRCGTETQGRFGDVVICDDCYHISGSCCPEFDPECLENGVISKPHHAPLATSSSRPSR